MSSYAANGGGGEDNIDNDDDSSAADRNNNNATENDVDDDDDSALSLSLQKNRPQDIRVQQQRIQAWHPILDPEWMVYTFLAIAIIMIPVGFKLEAVSNSVVELHTVYDSINKDDQICGIGLNYDANKTCTISFTVPKDIDPPILIYYELTNFHQNHRFYSSSRDDFQLVGVDAPQTNLSASMCDPLNKLGNVTLNPCGLIANTFFNDIFELVDGSVDDVGEPLKMIEKGIAWQSDLEYRFGMPPGFKSAQCTPEQGCDPSCCTSRGWSCTQPYQKKEDGTCWAYHYPNENTTQYLYETYPNIISPLEHVTNEHFVVWMRVATRPHFRKLYGYISQKVLAGTELNFRINSNYVVESFAGSKAIIVSTNNIVGGKNPYLGQTFWIMGFICLAFGLFFAMKHWFRPRKLGDRKYLHYKED